MNVSPWLSPMFVIVAILAVVGLILLVRAWPRPGLSTEERRELAGTPMPPLKKRAWLGLVIALATTVTVTGMVASRGAMSYWENDDFRLTVVMIFIAGLVLHSVLNGLMALKNEREGGMDERDRNILARAPAVQTAAVLLTLAAWLVTLGQRFHDQGAVPMVYMYLLFGSVILAMMVAQSLGVLLFYWLGTGHGEA